jgi:hypothetical protein
MVYAVLVRANSATLRARVRSVGGRGGDLRVAVAAGWQNRGRSGQPRGQGAVTIRAGSPRWKEINASAWAHERAGLAQVRELLPDADPYYA